MKSYPVLRLLVRHGGKLSLVAGALALLAGIGSAEKKLSPGTLLRSFGLAGLVGLGVKNLSELNEIIADALLPQ